MLAHVPGQLLQLPGGDVEAPLGHGAAAEAASLPMTATGLFMAK